MFLGDAWLGEEHKEGYIETMLTSRLGGKKASFRNLAWGRESAAGGSRAGLESELKWLKEPLQAIKPTVAILGYGMDEAGNGEAGLQRFKNDIQTLMDTVTNISMPDQVRFVMVTPPYQEGPAGPMPEAAVDNTQLELSATALREIAAERNARLVDVFEAMRKEHGRRRSHNWTGDGVHLTPDGYWHVSGVFEGALNLFPGIARMGIGRNNSIRRGGAGVTPENIGRTETKIWFTGKDEFVFEPLEPKRPDGTNAPDGFLIQFYPVPPEKYTLKIDGEISAVESGAAWMNAVMVRRGPLFDRVEDLRRAIIHKNELCQRSGSGEGAYLFGFRNNKRASDGRDIPERDPVISAEEEKIFRLTELKARKYELAPAVPGDEEKLKPPEEKPHGDSSADLRPIGLSKPGAESETVK